MLSRHHRLSGSAAFAAAIRRGRRAGSRTLVVHLQPAPDQAADRDQPGAAATRVGFVVSKAVGNAVVRNQVKRRLRHLARERLSSLPGSAVLVVRALPPAAAASYDELAADLDRALARTTRHLAGAS